MSLRRLTFAALVPLFLSQPTPSVAQVDLNDIWREAFAGWGGIIFECETPAAYLITPRELTRFETAVCDAAVADARFLALGMGIPFVGCTDCRARKYVLFNERYGSDLSPLQLVLEVITVESATLIGGAIRLEAGAVYPRAVDRGLAAPPPPWSPRAEPRNGFLRFWSSGRGFYGPPDTLPPAVSSQARIMLTGFFEAFALGFGVE